VNTPKTLLGGPPIPRPLPPSTGQRLGADELPGPIKFVGEALPAPTKAPTVGEHTDDVLREGARLGRRPHRHGAPGGGVRLISPLIGDETAHLSGAGAASRSRPITPPGCGSFADPGPVLQDPSVRSGHVVLWASRSSPSRRGLHFLRLLLSLWLAFFASGVQHGREILDDRRRDIAERRGSGQPGHRQAEGEGQPAPTHRRIYDTRAVAVEDCLFGSD